jgi:hypothetical protein
VLPMVNVEVAAAVPEIVTDVGEMLQLIGVLAPVGTVVTLHERSTAPVNPPDGVTVIVDVSPVVAPPVSEIGPLLLKANVPVVVVEVTVTSTVVVCVMDPDLPVTVTTYAPGVVAVVLPMDKVPVAAAVPEMTTDAGTLQLIGLVAPVGTVVTLHCSVTVPVNPPDGVALIVDVSPVVAPPASVMLPLLLSVKLGVVETAPLTAAEMPSVWMKLPDVPVISTL